MTQYDEMTARVMVQSIMSDVMDMRIRKTSRNRVVEMIRSILPDPIRYLEMQKGKFSYEKPNILGAKQDDETPTLS